MRGVERRGKREEEREKERDKERGGNEMEGI